MNIISCAGASKTLMFLEGCSQPHLGCTVLLRGGPTAELAKVKRVTNWLCYTLYNWRLELSFLMDAFTQPPPPAEDTFFQEDAGLKLPLTDSALLNNVASNLLRRKANENSKRLQDNSLFVKKVKSVDKENINIEEDMCNTTVSDCKQGSDFVNKGSLKVSAKDKSVSEEWRSNTQSVSDFSDPLHLYLNLEDEVFSDPNNGQSLAVSELPQANKFKKALDDTVLTVSPFLKVCTNLDIICLYSPSAKTIPLVSSSFRP